VRATLGSLRRRLRGGDAKREAELEAKVTQLKAKLADLRERRVVAQFATPYVEGPLFRLDYDKAEIEVVAAARHRTARAQTKEPFTVEWIEANFGDGDVLYDIGANVGSYSLIAASVASRGTVYAFEPSFASFAVLCSNIAINGLDERIVPIPLALGATTSTTTLKYWGMGPGSGVLDESVRDDAGTFEQRALCVRLDDLVQIFGLRPPTLVKLDVDGVESDVIAGAAETLSAARSVIVELENDDDSLLELLARHGFDDHELHQRRGSSVRYATLRRTRVPVSAT
jgi:FkbM family methyltransferase